MRFVTDPSSSRQRIIALIVMLAAAFAFSAGCEVDPDDDYPLPPVVPAPKDDDKNDDENGEDDEPPGETDPGDGDDDDNPPVEGGGACFGHCDCTPDEYCATVGTCQPRVAGAGFYCCDRSENCPTGEACHIAGTINEIGYCGE